jgi:hypothetical protein
VASNYLTITQGTDTDKSIKLDLSASSKQAIDISANGVQQYSVDASNSGWTWINLGNLKTELKGNNLKFEILFSEGDTTAGQLQVRIRFIIETC